MYKGVVRMKWQTKIEMFLNNQELLQDIKSVMMLIVSILLPILYFAYSQYFELDGLLNWRFGVLSVFVVVGNIIVFFESSDKAMRDEKTANEDVPLAETETEKAQATLPKQIDMLIAFNKHYNDREQNNKNLEFTNEVIRKYEIKILKRKIRGKPYEKLEAEIDRLRDTPLYNKKYKPVRINNIVSLQKVKSTEISGDDAFNVNPKTYGFKRFVLKQPLKALSVGSSGMFILGFTESFATIFVFYLVYLLSLAILFALRYKSARDITKTLYVKSLRNKCNYIEEYHDFAKDAVFEIDFSAPFDKVPKEKALI